MTGDPQRQQRNVEIVRRGFDAFETMDMDAFTADWAPDVVWNVQGYRDWPGSRTEYVGAAEILGEFANFLGTVKSQHLSGLEVTPLDDGRVLAIYVERRITEEKPIPVDLDVGILYTFGPDDRIARIEVYTGHDEARRAASL